MSLPGGAGTEERGYFQGREAVVAMVKSGLVLKISAADLDAI